MGRNNEKPPRDSKEVELLPKLERIGHSFQGCGGGWENWRYHDTASTRSNGSVCAWLNKKVCNDTWKDDKSWIEAPIAYNPQLKPPPAHYKCPGGMSSSPRW